MLTKAASAYSIQHIPLDLIWQPNHDMTFLHEMPFAVIYENTYH